MPINCLVKCLIKFWTVMFQKSIHGQFVNNSWTFMFQKSGPFVLRLLSLPLLSSLFLSLSPFVSPLKFFYCSLLMTRQLPKNQRLEEKTLSTQIFESRENAKTQNVRHKIRPMIRPPPRRPHTPHAARNWPYILRRETLHYVGFHVGFADQTLHT